MELEAPPRQWIERAAAAPVERQKAARLAGRRAGDGVTLDDGRPRAASACEVGNRGADRAATADHDARGRDHGSYCVSVDGSRPAMLPIWAVADDLRRGPLASVLPGCAHPAAP